MKFTKKLLLPRIKRKKDTELEKFVVQNINKELKGAKNDYNLVQMQYFFESVFGSRKRRMEMLKKVARYKNNGTSRDR